MTSVAPILWWYLARASGLVAWAALVATIVWGVLLATRLLRPHDRPAWMTDLHRWFGGLALATTTLHLVALVADSNVHFGLTDLLVPFASDWRPGAVAVGVAALYLLVLVEVSSLLRPRLSRRTWRLFHLASYPLAFAVPVHAALAGTDTTNAVYRVAAVVGVTILVATVSARLLVPANGRRGMRTTAS